MKKTVSLVLSAALCLLAACAPAQNPSDQSSQPPEEDRRLHVCSWAEYIDPTLIRQFEEETGIIVHYSTVRSNQELYAKLETGEFDLICPSDYMAQRLMEEGKLAPVDHDQLENYQFVDPQFQNLVSDPENAYTVPYAWGTLGLIYNASQVSKPITSWGALFDGQYDGAVQLLQSQRDAFAIALLYLGYPINTTDPDQLQQACDLLARAQKKGVFRSGTLNTLPQALTSGEVTLGAYYSGDYLVMSRENPDLRFVIPEEGGIQFLDVMCIPANARNQEEALLWMDFMLSTQSSLQNMDATGFASPNTQAMEQFHDYYQSVHSQALEERDWQVMNPPKTTLDNCQTYRLLPAETRSYYASMWEELALE